MTNLLTKIDINNRVNFAHTCIESSNLDHQAKTTVHKTIEDFNEILQNFLFDINQYENLIQHTRLKEKFTKETTDATNLQNLQNEDAAILAVVKTIIGKSKQNFSKI